MLFGHHVVNLLQQALWIVQKYGIQLPWRDSLSSGFTTCILPSNHLLFHLMDTYLPVPVKEGKETYLSKAPDLYLLYAQYRLLPYGGHLGHPDRCQN